MADAPPATTATYCFPPTLYRPGRVDHRWRTWSEEGSQLTYIRYTFDAYDTWWGEHVKVVAAARWIGNADGSGHRKLLDTSEPAGKASGTTRTSMTKTPSPRSCTRRLGRPTIGGSRSPATARCSSMPRPVTFGA